MASLDSKPATVAAAQRFNIYQSVHKGLRAMLCDMLQAIGNCDLHEPAPRQHTLTRLHQELSLCHCHLQHEDLHLHRAMEARAPGSSSQRDSEHHHHVGEIIALQRMADGMNHLPDSELDTAWQALYARFSLFVADNFEHMLHEEQDNMAVLWAHYSDAELIELHDVLVAGIPADEMAQWFRWIVPNVTHNERVAMFLGMRQGMPAAIFAQHLDAAAALLPAPQAHKLQLALAA